MSCANPQTSFNQCATAFDSQNKAKRKTAKWSSVYLKPEIVFSLVCHLSMVITDVTFPDQAVDGSLVGVGTVPQHSAVVEAKLVLWSRRKAAVQGSTPTEGGRRKEKAYNTVLSSFTYVVSTCISTYSWAELRRSHRLSGLFMYSWNQVLKSPSWCCTLFTTCMAAFRSPQRRQ